MRFAWAKEDSFEGADVIILGVTDESGSHALRKGASKAPDQIRKVSNEREIFERKGIKTITLPEVCGLNKKIFDYGNVKKGEIAKLVEIIVNKGEIPVTIGGDHSITAEILKGIDKTKRKISIVYFDAHPDFICSSRKYYGSVVCDITEYENIDFSSSIEIGMYGAKTSVYTVQPAWGIAVDVTSTDDFSPNPTKRLGNGPCITIKDEEMLGNRCINGWLKDIAKKNKRKPYYIF